MVILGEMVGHLFCSKLYITRTIKHFLDDILRDAGKINKIAGTGVHCLKSEKN